MGRIAAVSIAPPLATALEHAGLDPLAYGSSRSLNAADAAKADALDVIVLGEGVGDPTHGAAHAYRLDPSLSVFILGADAGECDRLRAALRFAPLVGKDVICADASASDVVQVIESAAARTAARRKHRQLLSAITPRHSGETPLPVTTVTPGRERFADRLMELAPVAILAIDPHRRIVTANASAERIFGREERALLGLVLGGDDLGHDGGGWDRLLDSSNRQIADAHRFERTSPGDGRPRVLDARAIAIEMEAGEGWLVVVVDVSAQADAEQQRSVAYRRAEEAGRA